VKHIPRAFVDVVFARAALFAASAPDPIGIALVSPGRSVRFCAIQSWSGAPLAVPPQPPNYPVVSWPVRVAIVLIALGAGWTTLETWASGIRLAKIISAIGARQAEAEAAQAKRAAEPGEPGVVYIQPSAKAPPKPR
jgi:hypothetical protein